mmetsp:Transcript_55716/g.124383  ORF Transcript_55716/g.124383 Transcript_55716/m.124383 type:complete len:310 (-) Transcript_55716:151-1080(-)
MVSSCVRTGDRKGSASSLRCPSSHSRSLSNPSIRAWRSPALLQVGCQWLVCRGPCSMGTRIPTLPPMPHHLRDGLPQKIGRTNQWPAQISSPWALWGLDPQVQCQLWRWFQCHRCPPSHRIRVCSRPTQASGHSAPQTTLRGEEICDLGHLAPSLVDRADLIRTVGMQAQWMTESIPRGQVMSFATENKGPALASTASTCDLYTPGTFVDAGPRKDGKRPCPVASYRLTWEICYFGTSCLRTMTCCCAWMMAWRSGWQARKVSMPCLALGRKTTWDRIAPCVWQRWNVVRMLQNFLAHTFSIEAALPNG